MVVWLKFTLVWESIYNIVITILFYSDLNNPEESPIGLSKDSPTTAGKVIKFMSTHIDIVWIIVLYELLYIYIL